MRFVLAFLLLFILITACTRSPDSRDDVLPPLPTAKVPPLSEVDRAIERWERSNTLSYFAEIEERKDNRTQRIRLVVADGKIRVAQRLERDQMGSWMDPFAMPLDEAQPFMVDQLLARVRRDVQGLGAAPLNMQVTFDIGLGFPAVVVAEALPTYSEDGRLHLNREHSYTLTVTIKALLEDVYRAGRQTIVKLTRSGGDQAWCDSLQIFTDASSLYADDCRGTILQIRLPASRFEELEGLRDSFVELEAFRQDGDQIEHLAIHGKGEGEADAATVENAWQLAAILHELLSQPVGLGDSLVYLQDGRIYGFDVFNQTSQRARVRHVGRLRGVAISPDQQYLAFSDDNGLNIHDINQETATLLLTSPEDGYYLPRAWLGNSVVIVTQVPATDADPYRWGWVSTEEKEWHDLPLPEGLQGYGCDTGIAVSPSSRYLAITGLDYGAPCNSGIGLTVVDLEANEARRIVSPRIASGVEGRETILAGAHNPAWSPDGQWIVVGLDQDARAPLIFPSRLYRVRPDGNDLSPLTNNAVGRADYPVWSPDGGNLFYALSGVEAELEGIYRYDPRTNTHTLLVSGFNQRPLSVSPTGTFLAYEQNSDLRIWGFLQQESSLVSAADNDLKPTQIGWFSLTDGN